jgi:transposase
MRKFKRPVDIGLDGRDRRQLTKALRQVRDSRTYRRMLAVLCIAQGLLLDEVAKLVGMSRRSIYRWIDRYGHGHRVDDLPDRARSGRPAIAAAISDRRIGWELRRDPMKLGYQTSSWTVGLLAKHLTDRYDCPISARTLRRRLDQMGLSWKRPRYRYPKVKNLPQKKGRSSAA